MGEIFLFIFCPKKLPYGKFFHIFRMKRIILILWLNLMRRKLHNSKFSEVKFLTAKFTAAKTPYFFMGLIEFRIKLLFDLVTWSGNNWRIYFPKMYLSYRDSNSAWPIHFVWSLESESVNPSSNLGNAETFSENIFVNYCRFK